MRQDRAAALGDRALPPATQAAGVPAKLGVPGECSSWLWRWRVCVRDGQPLDCLFVPVDGAPLFDNQSLNCFPICARRLDGVAVLPINGFCDLLDFRFDTRCRFNNEIVDGVVPIAIDLSFDDASEFAGIESFEGIQLDRAIFRSRQLVLLDLCEFRIIGFKTISTSSLSRRARNSIFRATPTGMARPFRS